jgi:hypothetical protein
MFDLSVGTVLIDAINCLVFIVVDDMSFGLFIKDDDLLGVTIMKELELLAEWIWFISLFGCFGKTMVEGFKVTAFGFIGFDGMIGFVKEQAIELFEMFEVLIVLIISFDSVVVNWGLAALTNLDIVCGIVDDLVNVGVLGLSRNFSNVSKLADSVDLTVSNAFCSIVCFWWLEKK